MHGMISGMKEMCMKLKLGVNVGKTKAFSPDSDISLNGMKVVANSDLLKSCITSYGPYVFEIVFSYAKFTSALPAKEMKWGNVIT